MHAYFPMDVNSDNLLRDYPCTFLKKELLYQEEKEVLS